MKTLIAVPCMDQVPALFCQSLAQLQKIGECSLAMKMGSLIYTSRNDLAMSAIAGGYDYIFWLDSDMVFKPDTLIRMVDTMKKNDLDILSGLYFRRVPPYSPVLFDRLEMKGEICRFSEFKTLPNDLFEVGGIGFGCVLMDVSVLISVQSRHNNMFTPIGNNGEDIAFCIRARECGYRIFCDPSVVCGHVGYSIVDDQFFRVFSEDK